MMRMAGKTVLVTGAGKGMGRVHAVRLAEEGADIVALDLPGRESETDLAETARLVEQQGRRVVTGTADIRDFDALTAAVRAGARELGPLDVVVANAGISDNPGPSWEIDDAVWNRSIDVNVTGTWHTVKAGVAEMDPSGGSVVIVSSTAAIKAVPGASHYSAAKHAITGLAKTLANELGPRAIRVNTVHPGAVATAMTLNPATFARLRPDLENPTAADVAEVLATKMLLPVPWVESIDVSNAVLFLASDESRYVTGLQMVIDAGQTQKVA
ncbi:mycofactocin-coupled SDR family oxidoreductase [Rhodococcus sp. TAF43]|uniref:mycofactocin-coupled SDR family oxidoreductase n=1 Tax=unclassified Rhodococcus (in: high G+C Gram-positive bacteria) TaxID=192944 RepID=UPI000E0B127B|nr:mycofactocin-coupled SDR family oxidoreductase [Rhodococcus sp. AG1013]RDI26853.1 SDR family mycofactocin-dependent oxidoreductase [Rhodococcus sp. AG1013]